MRYHLELVGDDLSAYSAQLTQQARLLILSKSDLCGDEEREKILERFRQDGFDPICISADTGEGLEALRGIFYAQAVKKEADKAEGQNEKAEEIDI